MSRSFRKPYAYQGKGARPKQGKKFTSKKLRRKASYLCYLARMEWEVLHEYDCDYYLGHPQDKKRGRAGSRDPSWGWDYFGDGRFYSGLRKPTPRGHLPEIPGEDWWEDWCLKRYGISWKEREKYWARKLSRK